MLSQLAEVTNMKRFVMLSLLAGLTLTGLARPAAAAQVGLGNPAADLNGDGQTTLHEVVTYNRDQRDKS